MIVFFKIAWRNILRNKRRTAITLSAISFGLAAVVFLWSFVDGFQHQMVDSIQMTITGDLQIYPKDAEGLYNANLFLKEPQEVREVIQKMPEVRLWVERVVASSIVSTAHESIMSFALGIDPRKEIIFNPRNLIIRGRDLKPGEEHATVIGAPMAKQLKTEVGDKVVLMMQDRYGALVGEAFQIVGIFETGSDQIDHSTVFVNLSFLQKLLSLDNQVTKFLLRLHPGVSLDLSLQKLRDRLSVDRYRVSPWEEIVPMLAQLIDFQQRMILVVVIIVLLVLSAGVLNTLMMSFVERIRELGLMKALGTKNYELAVLLIFETFWLSFLGTCLGLGVGLGWVVYFSHHGIDLTRFGQTFSNFLVGTTIYPLIHVSHVLTAALVVMGTNLLASLYPAWRASRLQPIEAMRQSG